jgi:hypothetical protein
MARFLIFNEISTNNCFPAERLTSTPQGHFWVVELFADAGFFNQKRRDAG